MRDLELVTRVAICDGTRCESVLVFFFRVLCVFVCSCVRVSLCYGFHVCQRGPAIHSALNILPGNLVRIIGGTANSSRTRDLGTLFVCAFTHRSSFFLIFCRTNCVTASDCLYNSWQRVKSLLCKAQQVLHVCKDCVCAAR